MTGLTSRELEICRLAADGLANKEIAWRSKKRDGEPLTEGTVKQYMVHAFRKTGATNRTELARWYFLHVEMPRDFGDCSKCLLRALHTRD